MRAGAGRISPRAAVCVSVAEHQSVHSRDDAEVEFGRVVAFTDGVFSIAITLLVLSLEIPPNGDVGELLSERGDQFFAYFLSFAVLARLWLSHHRFYGAVARFDGRLIALNLFYLAFIALLPFSTELLGNYSDESVAVAIYAANLTVVALFFVSQTYYVYRQDLIKSAARHLEVRLAGPANLAVAIVFGASIPIAFLSPTVAMLSWMLMFVAGRRIGDSIAGVSAPK